MKAGVYRKSQNFENGTKKEIYEKVVFGLNRLS